VAYDPYENPSQARSLGLLGPTIMSSLKAMHARDIAKQMMMGGFKRGGKVKRTGFAKLHKGERVLTKKQTKRMKRR